MILDTLFHWSPARRRAAIETGGLTPGCEPTTCTATADVVCLSPDPRWAWRLSAGTDWTPAGDWDLWQVRLVDEYDVRLRVEDGRVLEVRVAASIPPGQLWRVGSRHAAGCAQPVVPRMAVSALATAVPR